MSTRPPSTSSRQRRSARVGIAAVVAAAATAVAALLGASPATAAPGCTGSVTSLRDVCSQRQLDALFLSRPAGPIPYGVTNGQVRPLGGPNPVATFALTPLWQGKHFYPGWLTNRVLGIEAFPADVYYGRSVLDGRPVIRIDYRRSGFSAGHDEIRMLANGVYLGFGYLNNVRQVDFWLWR